MGFKKDGRVTSLGIVPAPKEAEQKPAEVQPEVKKEQK